MEQHQSIHDRIGDKIELAQTYFEDGAPFSAARVLREAAEILEQVGRDRAAEPHLIARGEA